MRDLVESVIDGLLQQEKMQQHAAQQKKHRAIITSRPAQNRPVDQARLHAVGPQTPVSNKERDPDLWKVSRQFEAIFVQQMMSEMRKTVNKSDFMPNGFAEDVHASMMDDAIAQASVRHHSFGIADSIYRQLEAAQSASKQSDPKQSAPNLSNIKQMNTEPLQSAQQPPSGQEISTSADKLTNHQYLILGVKHHAH